MLLVNKMEQGTNEMEYDEFEKLLGEIPNVTSGNSYSEESGVINCSDDLKRESFNAALVTESQKRAGDGILVEGKEHGIQIQQPENKKVESEETNILNDQAIAALAKLRLKDSASLESEAPTLANSTALLSHRAVVSGQYIDGAGRVLRNMDPHVVVIPSPRGANGLSAALNGFHSNIEENNGHQRGYFNTAENISSSVPLTPVVQGIHLRPNLPTNRAELPICSNQQQYYLDTPSPSVLPYFHLQVNQANLACNHTREEQYYRMHQQYLYMQQLRNQLDSHNQIQANGMVRSRPINRSSRQQFVEMPNSHMHLNQESWDKDAISRSINPLNPMFCTTNSDAMQLVDKSKTQSFHERITRRPHGLNSVKSVNLGSVGGNHSLLPSAYLNHNFPTPSAEFQLGCLGSRAPSDAAELKFSMRSQLLKYSSIDEFAGKIYLMAKDQNGCRLLQKKFAEGTSEDVDKIFPEIIVHMVELMIDPFGNYLIQKLLEVCNEDQRMQILRAITRKPGDLVRISCDMHGTRAVQKLIETLRTPEQFSMIVSCLKPGLVNLIKNMNGNHVAQRCLQYLTPEYREFMFEAAISNCVELATDRHGCCVLQKCLSQSDGEQRHRLICEITSNALFLSQDPFGNYVVQYIIDSHLPYATADILEQLQGKYADLSMQKYSSNVVEKCLKHAEEGHCSCIIEELIRDPRLDQIMQDPYGNYVIQEALNRSKGALHAALVEAVRVHVPVLRTNPYGKKILSCKSLKK